MTLLADMPVFTGYDVASALVELATYLSKGIIPEQGPCFDGPDRPTPRRGASYWLKSLQSTLNCSMISLLAKGAPGTNCLYPFLSGRAQHSVCH